MELLTQTKTHPTGKGMSCQGLEEGQSSASPTSRLKQYTMSLNFSAWPWFENAAVELI